MPIVHLIEAGSRVTCPTMLALLGGAQDAAGPGADDEVLLLGGPALVEAARASAVRRAYGVAVPWGRALAGLPRLARQLRGRRVERLVCWSLGSLAAAMLLRPGTPRTLVLLADLSPGERRWLDRLLARPATRARTSVACLQGVASEELAAALARRGVPVQRLAPAAWRERFEPMSREQLRQRWHLPGEDSPVVAVLADPPAGGDATRAVLVAGLAAETLATAGHLWSVTLLLHPAHRGRLRSQALLAPLPENRLVVRLEPELACPWRVLGGCEATLDLSPTAPGLSAAWARAMDRPMIDATGRGSPARPAHELHELLAGGAGVRGRGIAGSTDRGLVQRWAAALGLALDDRGARPRAMRGVG